MKAVPLLFVTVFVPMALHAQDLPPAGLEEVEFARSRSCVGALTRLEELNTALAPFATRMERLRMVGRAVSLEDVTEAGTLDAADTIEAAVARWFVADSTLAARWVAERTDALTEERSQARAAIVETIRAAMEEVGTEAQGQLGGAAAVEAEARPCGDAILVRSVVRDACIGMSSAVCRAAVSAAPVANYRFVDAAADLWDVSDYRPWTQPEPLQATPQGALVGSRTSARARRGNILLTMALAPLIRNRAEINPEEVKEFDANIDSLGFVFDHPLLVMAPALEITANVPPAMDGETHILVHFGDLTGQDVIWSTPLGEAGVIQAVFPASAADLGRLQAGEVVSLTAVRVVEGEEAQAAEPVYTVPLLTVNQAASVSALLQYMGGGDLNRDLAGLISPDQGVGSPGR